MSGGHPPPRAHIPALASLPLVLQTSRLTLRPFAESDVEALYPLVSDPELPKHMTWAAHTDPAQTAAFIAFQQKAIAEGVGCAWAIVHEGRAAGCISLDEIKWWVRAIRVDAAELGYWLDPALHGRGLMTEAGLAVLSFAFGALGLHKIHVAHLEPNIGSRRVIEKLGFRPCGRFEDDVYRDGTWYTHLRYEMTAMDFLDSSTTMRISRPPRT